MKARERLLQDTPISAEHLAVLADRVPARLPQLDT
jgi:hypothetical protein